MTWIGKYWKVLLAIVLLIVAVLAVFLVLQPQDKAMEQQMETTKNVTDLLQDRLDTLVAENEKLEEIKDKLPAAMEAVDAAREELKAAHEELTEDRDILYDNFPGGLKEEDQILYVMDLEEILNMELFFGREWDNLYKREGQDYFFEFGHITPITRLTDGSVLCTVNIKIDFDMSYDAFKNMLLYLEEDPRITSINYTKIDYDAENDHVVGFATLLYYFLASEDNEYVEPEIDVETGRDSLFDASNADSSQEQSMVYVLDLHTKVFHLPGCKNMEDMDPDNTLYVNCYREDCIDSGFNPCGNCNP